MHQQPAAHLLFSWYVLISVSSKWKSDVIAIQDVVDDRVILTLAEVISRIQRNLDEQNYEGVGVSVKTVCERYFSGTAVSFDTNQQSVYLAKCSCRYFWLPHNIKNHLCSSFSIHI